MRKKLLLSLMLIVMSIIAFSAISASAATIVNVSTVSELQSAHPYSSSMDTTWIYTHPTAADSLIITFSSDTATESNYDWIYILDGNGNQIEKQSGSTLAGKTITVPGNVVKIRLTSDGNGQKNGFKVTKINAISTKCGNNLTWVLDDNGVLKISGTGDMYNWSNGDNVPWYASRSKITAVEISTGVTSIGSYAFYSCDRITSITIPDSMTSVGTSAFNYCSRLESVNITDIAAWCKINFNSYYGTPFFYAKNLYVNGNLVTELIIPDGVTTIGSYAFYNCDFLTSVTFPDSVRTIGESAFSSCENITSLVLPEKLSIINGKAFWYCSALTDLSISSAVKCYSYTVGSYGSNVYAYPFYKCENIKNLTLKNNGYIDSYVLDDMANLERIEVIGEHDTIASIDGILYDKDKTKILFCPFKQSGSITIPETVTEIGEEQFQNRKNITEIVLRDGVTMIGTRAFYGCDGLTSITIPDSVTYIGSSAFSGCVGLTSITIPGGVTTIESSAFSGCDSLTSITIPDSVTYIGSYAFSGCIGLTSIAIPDSVTVINDELFSGCENLSKIVLPENLEHIGSYIVDGTMFYNNEENWYEGMLYIDHYLIAANYTRDKFTVKDGTKIIASNVFLSHNISEIALPDGLQVIGNAVFYNCDKLLNIIIPNSVTRIGSSAFYDCDGLVDIVIPGSVKNINSYMFYDCDGLLSVILEDGVATIGSNVFYNCDKLKTIIIPGSVTETMGFCAICDCTWLTDVYYGGNSWYNIYDNKYNLHFDGCGRATLKYFRNVTILDVEGNTVDKIRKDLNSTLVLSDISLEYGQCAKLYTDKELKSEYKIDTPITEHLTLYADIMFGHTTTSVSEDGNTFKVNAVNIENGNTVILALYTNHKFVEMQKATYEGDEITFTAEKPYTNAKVMVWENLNNLMPVTDVEIVK